MNKVLLSVVLKNKQTIPFLVIDKDQENKILKFKDIFFQNHESNPSDYSISLLHFNQSSISLNYDKQINKFFIKEFGLFVSPNDVIDLKLSPFVLMGRYYLFAGERHSTNVGFFDLIYIHDNPTVLEDILDHGLYAARLNIDWYHVIDMKTNKIFKIKKPSSDLIEDGCLDILGH
jgi:hypothetical protein